MKKIAFVLRFFQEKNFHGGGEKLFFSLIKRFIASNCHIDIYCSKSDIKKIDGINNIVVIDEHYDHKKPETMEAFYEKVKSYTAQEQYDYVISENITPPLDITFLQGHSLVHRLNKNKNLFEKFLYNFRKVKKNRIEYHQKWLSRGYRKIFVVSEVLKKDLVDNYEIAPEKIAVVYPGVDVNEDFVGKKASDVLTFGLSAPGFSIKGGFVFLKALGVLKKQGYEFNAKIIYPKYKKNLGVKLLVKILNIEKNIEFLGFQKNMQDFYNSLDCLVAPSYEDTFNLAVLEAMASKTPCVVSNYAGASEIIKDGENGFVFDMEKNAENNLAKKMIELLDDKELFEKISQKGFDTAKLFSWDRTFASFCKELDSL